MPYRDALFSIEEIIEDTRAGRMVKLVDDEERKNEGDRSSDGSMPMRLHALNGLSDLLGVESTGKAGELQRPIPAALDR